MQSANQRISNDLLSYGYAIREWMMQFLVSVGKGYGLTKIIYSYWLCNRPMYIIAITSVAIRRHTIIAPAKNYQLKGKNKVIDIIFAEVCH